MSAPPSSSGEGAPGRTRLSLAGLVLAVLAVRLAVAASLPLTEDEAYYRAWSEAPALGYYDHPPMIAWWIWLGRRIAGDTALGVRLLPSLACALTSLLAFDLAAVLGAAPRLALRAAVWHNAAILVAAGGFLAIPDAPAALFWMAGLAALARAERDRRLAWWLAAGLAAGLASLSKYSALFLAPGALLWLLSAPRGRAALKTPGPWLALAIAAALFGLNLGWNAAHHWETFAKQFGRIAPHGFAPAHLAALIVGQALLFNPLMTAFLARALVGRGPEAAIRRLALSCAPFAAYLALHALHDRVQAHWPAPLYAPLALAAALASGDRAGGAWKRLQIAVPYLAAILCAAALGLFALPGLGVRPPIDIGRPLRGWTPFSESLERLRIRAGAAWIGTASYGLAAQLLAEPAIRAPVVQIRERARWLGLRPSGADMARPGLVVDLARRFAPGDPQGCFSSVRPLGELARGGPSGAARPYQAFLVGGRSATS